MYQNIYSQSRGSSNPTPNTDYLSRYPTAQQQQGQAAPKSSSSSQRPTSAGAVRTKVSSSGNNTNVNVNNSGLYHNLISERNTEPINLSGAYGRASHTAAASDNSAANIYMGAGSNPIMSSGLLGSALSNSSSQGQRPSSAGYLRPSPNSISGQVNANIQQQQQQHSVLPSATTCNQPVYTSAPGVSRPKSANAVRKPYEQPTTAVINNNPHQYFNQHPKLYPPSSSANAQQPQQQQFQYSSNNNTTSGRPSTGVPSVSSYSNANNLNPADHWSTSYKLHYGYAGHSSNPTSTSILPSSSIVPTTTDGQSKNDAASAKSSATTNRLRAAIDQSHKYGVSTDTGTEVTDEYLNVTDINGERRLLSGDDDDEMDGKIIDSRSHPEVSMTTPSQSIELGTTSIDHRNSSIDSLPDEYVNIGVSTVPNQFCSVKDALDLKKLLIMSKNSRGGIVPSSTAVMDMYMVGKVVGVGSYGKVRAAWHRLTGSKVAIKTYDKSKLKDPAHWKRVHSEIKIMETVSHPKIARMYEAVETPKRMHLIMECLDGGNLCSYVKQKKRLSEDESKRIFFQILQSIEFLHVQGVSHRDVKLENVLFTDGNNKDIKLIDFGFSTFCQAGKRLKVFCGTPSYMAPEIVRRTEYEGKPVDIWSLGILLYALLCGCFPFRAKSYPDLYRKIARGTFNTPEELSVQARDLLKQLLTVDINQRITAYAALRHPWLSLYYANAPDVDRIRLETPILISDRPADDIDDQVMEELEKFGFSKDDMSRLVLSKTHSSLATLYYLLLDVCISRRRMMGGGKRAMSVAHGTAGSSSSSKGKGGTTLGQHLAANPQQQLLLQQQQQQQQMLLNSKQQLGEYYSSSGSSRPRSASATRAPQINAHQRPLSAYNNGGRR